MRKVRSIAFFAALVLLSLGISASYPASSKNIPEGSVLLEGEIIGEKSGWDGSERTGRAAAFDGDIYTYYDPTVSASTDCYTGVKLSEPYILTMVCVMPRETYTDRFGGAMLQGSNDGKKWYTLWQSDSGASSWDWQVIKQFKNNTGYSYYRYCNDQNHGDVAEVELYGYPGNTGDDLALSAASKLHDVTVQFETCGGEYSSFFPITVTFGEYYPEIGYVPVREGYYFDGWYTSEEGGRKIDGSAVVTNPSRHSLYAHWTTEDNTFAAGDEPELPDEEGMSAVRGLCVTVIFASLLLGFVLIVSIKKKS